MEVGLLFLALLVGWSYQSHGLTGMKGMRGTFRVASGDAEARRNLSLNMWFDYWRKVPQYAQEEMSLMVAVAAVPRPSSELYIALGWKRGENLWGRTDETQAGPSDTEVGIKLLRPGSSFFKPGLNMCLSFPTGKDKFSSGRRTFGVSGITTLDFKDFESCIPLRVNVNAGYDFSGGGEKDWIPLGLSLELPSRFFTPIVEVTSEQNLKDTFSWKESPLRFTQGIKATPARRLCLHAGYDINLAQETERYIKSGGFDWRLFFGLTLSSRSLSGLGSEAGGIFGVVTDRNTGKPVAATISIKGAEGRARADPATGRYALKGLKAGLLSVVVAAEGYRKRVVPALVEHGKTTERNIKLAPERERSWVSLSATDRKTGESIVAHVRFEGASVKEAILDPTGILDRFEITPGKYKVFFDAPGYLRMSREFRVGPHRTEELSVSLLRVGEPLVVSGVSFAQSTATLKVESDEGIRGVVSLIQSNPKRRFEIGVHTDSGGAREKNLV
ncbi:MAG: carboxypeptidase regulatory-like domain-containing protein, partial [bacterium]